MNDTATSRACHSVAMTMMSLGNSTLGTTIKYTYYSLMISEHDHTFWLQNLPEKSGFYTYFNYDSQNSET